MNCRDVDRILNDHALRGLEAAERADLEAHVAVCRRCSRAAETQEALLGESFDGPRPGFFEATSRWVASAAPPATPPPPTASPRRRWQTVSGLAALGTLALIVLLSLPRIGSEVSIPSSPARDPSSVASDPASAALDVPREPEGARLAAFIEGRDFVRLPAQPAFDIRSADSSSVVIEFFMYLCGHCYRFEARLVEWFANQDPDAVSLIRVPVQWNAAAALHARAYYAAEALRVTDSVHQDLFEEIHERGNSLDSEADLRAFFTRHGVDEDEFDSALNSAAVEARLDQASELAARFQVDATPSVVVDETYLTTSGMAGSYDRLIEIVDWLADEERCEASC